MSNFIEGCAKEAARFFNKQSRNYQHQGQCTLVEGGHNAWKKIINEIIEIFKQSNMCYACKLTTQYIAYLINFSKKGPN